MGKVVYQAPEISIEEYKKYREKHVAIFKGKIVAAGTTAKEALTNALKKHPNAKTSQIALHYICPAEELIL